MSKYKNQNPLPTFNPFKVKGYDPNATERTYFWAVHSILSLKATQKAYAKDRIPFPMSLVNQMRDLYKECRQMERALGWRWEAGY